MNEIDNTARDMNVGFARREARPRNAVVFVIT
jgi:hypothetical protein